MGIQRIENKLRKKRLAMQEKREGVFSERLKSILVQEGTCRETDCENKLTCIYYQKKPKDKLMKAFVNMLLDQTKCGIFPTMPSDKWMQLHGTINQPIDWVDKPSIMELKAQKDAIHE